MIWYPKEANFMAFIGLMGNVKINNLLACAVRQLATHHMVPCVFLRLLTFFFLTRFWTQITVTLLFCFFMFRYIPPGYVQITPHSVKCIDFWKISTIMKTWNPFTLVNGYYTTVYPNVLVERCFQHLKSFKRKNSSI